MKNIKNQYPKPCIIVISVILFLVISFWDDITKKKYNQEYILLGKDTIEISGVVNVYKDVKVWAGTSAIEFTNGQKIMFSAVIRNYLYDTPDFYDCIDIGDSIRRPSGYAARDSIYLYKAKEGYKQYYFILGKVINKK